MRGLFPARGFWLPEQMEYSFGDNEKDGPLMLGLHEQGSFYNIVKTDGCQITDGDFNVIQKRRSWAILPKPETAIFINAATKAFKGIWSCVRA